MKIDRFEDMEVWQLTRKLVREVYEVTENTKFSRDIDLNEKIGNLNSLTQELIVISKSLSGLIKYLKKPNFS